MDVISTYAVGAIIIPDGRIVLSAEGGTKFTYDILAGLSVETFVSEVIGDLDPERALIVEAFTSLGLNLERDPSVNKLLESGITVETMGNHKRDLKFYIYKLSSMYTFEVKRASKSPIMFLSLDQIANQISNKTLNLSFCAKHMLKHLSNCQNLKNFKGNLS